MHKKQLSYKYGNLMCTNDNKRSILKYAGRRTCLNVRHFTKGINKELNLH